MVIALSAVSCAISARCSSFKSGPATAGTAVAHSRTNSHIHRETRFPRLCVLFAPGRGQSLECPVIGHFVLGDATPRITVDDRGRRLYGNHENESTML